jgi:hypothetical protein
VCACAHSALYLRDEIGEQRYALADPADLFQWPRDDGEEDDAGIRGVFAGGSELWLRYLPVRDVLRLSAVCYDLRLCLPAILRRRELLLRCWREPMCSPRGQFIIQFGVARWVLEEHLGGLGLDACSDCLDMDADDTLGPDELADELESVALDEGPGGADDDDADFAHWARYDDPMALMDYASGGLPPWEELAGPP